MLIKNFEFFNTFLTLERGLARNTVAAYTSDLRCFIDYCETCSVASADMITRDLILDYLAERQDKYGEQSTTLARKLISVKLFFRFLLEEKIIGHDPSEVMDSPRLWKFLPEYLYIVPHFSVNCKENIKISYKQN